MMSAFRGGGKVYNDPKKIGLQKVKIGLRGEGAGVKNYSKKSDIIYE